MCRLMAYYGDTALLAQTVCWPERSIIKQSYDARERLLDPSLPAHLGHGNLNADGFGIGWYSGRRDTTPCTFKAITPAWNNENLNNLAAKCYSPLVFAHVRAAYPGMPVSEQNCHPFAHGRYMFMHNGIIAGFSTIRRRLLDNLTDKAFNSVPSFHSDSAISFALFLSFLPSITEPQGPDVMLQALQKALQLIGSEQEAAGITDSSLLNFVVTDGATLIATRCVSPTSERPASMYYAEGTSFRRADGLEKEGVAPYSLDYSNKSARVILVASEPITGSASEWVAVPPNHGLVVTRDREGWMNVLHVPVSLQAPSPRTETVLRCLRSLAFDATDAAPGGRSLLTRAMRPGVPSMCCAPAPPCSARHRHSHSQNGTASPRGGAFATPACSASAPQSPDPHSSILTTSGNPLAATGVCSIRTVLEYCSGRASPESRAPGRCGSDVPPRSVTVNVARSIDQSLTRSSLGPGQMPVLEDLQAALPSVTTPNGRVAPFEMDASGRDRARLATRWDSSVTGAGADQQMQPHQLTGHTDAILSLALDEKGRLYSSSSDKSVKVWNLTDLKCVSTMAGHTKAVLRLQQQGDYLFSVGGPSIRVWELETGKCVRRILTSRQAGWIRAISVSPDLDLVVGCQDTTLKLYKYTADPPNTKELSAGGSFSSEAWHPGAAVPEVPRGRSHRPQSKQSSMGRTSANHTAAPILEGDEHEPPSTRIGGVGGGDRVPGELAGAAVFDMTVDTPDVTTPAVQGNLDDGHCAAIHAVVCNSTYVCTAGGDCVIRVWGMPELQAVSSMIGHRGPVFALLMVGGLLLSGGRDATIRVWDLDVFCCRRTLQGHTADILHLSSMSRSAFFYPGGSPSAAAMDSPFTAPPNGIGADTAGLEGSAGQSQGQEGGGSGGAEAEGEGEIVGKALVLVSCSADGSCRLWDVHTWTCVQVLYPHVGKEVQPVLCSAITASHLALGMPSGTLYVYDLQDLLDQVLAQQARTVDKFSRSWQTGDPENGIRSPAVVPVNSGVEGVPRSDSKTDTKEARSVVTWRRPFQDKQNAQQRVESQLLHCLSLFVGIRTVSGDPQLHEEVFRGAKFLAGLLESVGMQVKLAQNVRTVHPCVIARMEVCPSLPTIVFYGHYDVQPAQELAWTTNPFHMTSKDGYLFGRGTSDNKGPILAMVFAVKELLDRREGEVCAGLPCNLSFIFEGEEEIGSPGLASVVESHLSWFPDPRLIVISNSQWIGDDLPCLTYGMRGMLCATVRVDGGDRNLHSGNDGGVFNEPMADLVRLLSTLLDSQHNILVPGFYDDVDERLLAPALAGIKENNNQADFDVGAYADSLGVPALTCGSTLEEVLTSRWCLPTITIADIRSSTSDESAKRFGPTRFSVVPHFAQGQLSVRYVPNQNADLLLTHLTRHLQHEFRKLRSSNRLQVSVHGRGQWWKADPQSETFSNVAEAIGHEWGCKPLPVREGGTMPCASMLETLLGAPAIMLPMGQNSDNCHLANERLRRINLIKGKNVIRRIIEGFADAHIVQ